MAESVVELSERIARHLRATVLVDSGKAIPFVPERTSHKTDVQQDPETNHEAPGESGLTGEEASKFYQKVISLPKRNTRARVHDTKRTVPHKKVSHKKRSSPCVPGPKLFQYAQDNEVDLLQSALSSGQFDVDMRDNFHWTLLMVAAYAGHMSVVECLLERGAKWREYTHRDMNAVDLAHSRGHTDIANLIESSELQAPGLSSGKNGNQNFYCDSCQAAVSENPRASHSTSIVHLYSGQHRTSSLVPYGIPESNRGFQMLLRSGWNPKKGLGSHRQGRRFPVKTVLKQDRLGFGVTGGKAKVTHFSAHDREAVRSHRHKHKKEKQPKNKKDLLEEKHQEKQWERRMRTIMSHEDSHLFT